MRLRSLIHLLEAVKALARPDRIIVLGSSSLLAVDPELGESGQPLESSYDADLLLTPSDDEMAGVLAESVGQESLYAQRNGCFADILRRDITETLPLDWETRVVPMAGVDKVFALDSYDLALVKLTLGREKDLELLQTLLKRGIIQTDRLRKHYQEAGFSEDKVLRAGRHLKALLEGR